MSEQKPYERWVDKHGPGSVREYATGSRRDSRRGKGRYELVSPLAMREIAKHFEEGAEKYSSRNWELGQPLSWYLDSGLRHAYQLLEGDKSENHAAAWAWNAIAFLHTRESIRRGILPESLNDLPNYV